MDALTLSPHHLLKTSLQDPLEAFQRCNNKLLRGEMNKWAVEDIGNSFERSCDCIVML